MLWRANKVDRVQRNTVYSRGNTPCSVARNNRANLYKRGNVAASYLLDKSDEAARTNTVYSTKLTIFGEHPCTLWSEHSSVGKGGLAQILGGKILQLYSKMSSKLHTYEYIVLERLSLLYKWYREIVFLPPPPLKARATLSANPALQ